MTIRYPGATKKQQAEFRRRALIRDLINDHRRATGHRELTMAQLHSRFRTTAKLEAELKRVEDHAAYGDDPWEGKR